MIQISIRVIGLFILIFVRVIEPHDSNLVGCYRDFREILTFQFRNPAFSSATIGVPRVIKSTGVLTALYNLFLHSLSFRFNSHFKR